MKSKQALAEEHLVVGAGDRRPLEAERRGHLREDLDPLLEGEDQEIDERRDAEDAEQDQHNVGDEAARTGTSSDVPRPKRQRSAAAPWCRRPARAACSRRPPRRSRSSGTGSRSGRRRRPSVVVLRPGPAIAQAVDQVEGAEAVDGAEDRGEQDRRREQRQGDVPEGRDRPDAVDLGRLEDILRQRLQPREHDDEDERRPLPGVDEDQRLHRHLDRAEPIRRLEADAA